MLTLLLLPLIIMTLHTGLKYKTFEEKWLNFFLYYCLKDAPFCIKVKVYIAERLYACARLPRAYRRLRYRTGDSTVSAGTFDYLGILAMCDIMFLG